MKTAITGLAIILSALAAPAVLSAVPTVVLVHGAFADGSSWSDVIRILQARGIRTVAVQNSLASLADDVASTQRTIDLQQDKVVLVGHSWGGAVITQAGNNDKVSALVYVAAFAPDDGQSVNELQKDLPPPQWVTALVPDQGGYLRLTPDAVAKFFAQDLPLQRSRVLAATQTPIAAKAFDDRITHAAWHDKPDWFVETTQDQMIAPPLQKQMAQRMKAHVTTLNTSHVPMIAKPEAVAAVIVAACGL